MADLNLGPCCVCERTENVHAIMMLDKLCPIPGHGWGCFVCGLPSDGASVVVCDDCMAGDDIEPRLKFACRGYPGSEGRIPIADLRGVHQHDMSKHPESDYEPRPLAEDEEDPDVYLWKQLGEGGAT